MIVQKWTVMSEVRFRVLCWLSYRHYVQSSWVQSQAIVDWQKNYETVRNERDLISINTKLLGPDQMPHDIWW